MGDIADMMLEGCMCQGCGEILGHPLGYPVFCIDCQKDNGCDAHGNKPEKVQCNDCNKWVKESGLIQHIKAKHPETLLGVKAK